MRIGIVSSFPPVECGIATYSQFLTDALRALHQDVYVVSHIGGVGKQVFPVFDYEDEDLAHKAFSTMIRFTPDVVHIQHEFGLYGKFYGMQVVPMILRFRLSGLPVVTTLHTVYRDMPEVHRILLKNIISNSNEVIVHENFQKETLLNTITGISEKHIHVIEHGARIVDPVPNAKQKLGLPANHKVILMIGYFRPSKNFELIIRLMPELIKRNPEAILVVAGKVRGQEYRDYRSKLFKMIDESPVKDHIFVIRGQLKQDVFDTILSAADVVVLPYKINSQSGILAHSLSFGRPVVVSESGSMKEVMRRSGAGLVAQKEKDYIDHITRILQDDKLARQFSNNAKAYVKKHISWHIVAKKHLGIYQSLLEEPILESRTIWVE